MGLNQRRREDRAAAGSNSNVEFDTLAEKRLALFVFPPPELAELIQAKMDLIFDSNALLGDTRNVIGGAALYPPHITLKGAFRLAGDDRTAKAESSRRLFNALEELTAIQGVLVVTTDGLENHPSSALSITFDDPSVQKLRKLQASIIPIVDRARAPIVEPNYQGAAVNKASLEHGEPSVGERFLPHMTVVGGEPGGLTTPQQIELVRKLLNGDWYRGWTWGIDKIGLMWEIRRNGCWEVFQDFPFRHTK